jgi:hypothetical protein
MPPVSSGTPNLELNALAALLTNQTFQFSQGFYHADRTFSVQNLFRIGAGR